MYIVFFVLIVVASILLILAVLAQHPKSGMAANFGVSNQVMGVRQTTDFLEKFTWGAAIAIIVLSLATSMTIDQHRIDKTKSSIIESIKDSQGIQNINQIEVPSTTMETPATT
ncbi:MAG: preprotein translocase subunit SecG, partial [Rikenellaceae bacterium]